MSRHRRTLTAWFARVLCSLCMVAAVTHIANASEPAPLLRMTPLPAQIVMGQPLTLEVAVLVPGWLVAPPEAPASVLLDGATIRLAGSGGNVSETIDGVVFAGVRQRYTLLPLRAGTLNVPPIALTVRWSDGTRNPATTLHTPALALPVGVPPALAGLDYAIVTPRFQLAQTVDRRLDDLRVGHAFTRTITMSAVDMPAMQLPALRAAPIPGLSVYADAPQLDDTPGERGAPDRAERRQRFTYLAQKAGDYELPGIELVWLDSATQQRRVARVPALRAHVQALPAPTSAVSTPAASPSVVRDETSRRMPRRWLAAAVVGVLGLALLVAGWRYRAHLANSLRACASPEQRALWRSLRALNRPGTAARQLQALDAWFVAAAPGGMGMSRAFHGAPARQLDHLLRAVHAPGACLNPAAPMSRTHALRLLLALRWQWWLTRRRSDNQAARPKLQSWRYGAK